ncbi:hypothetical protein KI387_007421, partial [Taxus chinensis]
KSTLLNNLFHTNFREMDAFKGRTQTTQGIWLAEAAGIDPCTLVMDLEGTDGRERGEDDPTFEKQSALFALAVSDIVLINMWCHDIGREQAANKPLLKTVFQVMMRLFSPRKDNIVIRYTRQDQGLALLRQRFFNSIAPGGLAGDRRGAVPASAFPFSSQQIWKVIRENKDLDLPAHKVMVATVRCEEIANEKLANLTSDQGWQELEEAVQSGTVPSFGRKLSSILDKYLSDYDMEAAYFEESVRTAKRQHLMSKSLDLVFPAYQAVLGHLRLKSLNMFKDELDQALKEGEGFAVVVRDLSNTSLTEFDQGCTDATVSQATWDSSKIREKLRRDIDTHAASVCTAKLSEITTNFEKRLSETLAEPVASLLDSASKETWPSIRKLLNRETEAAISDFSSAISGFEMDDKTTSKMILNLRDYARSVVDKKAREEAGQVLIRMKERFSNAFSQDAESMPRVWTGKEDIRAITKDARSRSLKLLSVMAALRLEEKPDKIESVLSSSLLDSSDTSGAIQERSMSATVTPLASSTWDEVSPSDTLITPVQCKSLWRQFKTETEYTVGQAIAAQEASKRSSAFLPPPWAIVAMIVLGFNEFMTLLRNPLYLGVLFVLFLLVKALWVQLDIPGIFQHGIVSGILQLSTKFLPTIMGLLKRLADEGSKVGASGNSTFGPAARENGSFKHVPLQDMASESSSQGSSSASGLTNSSSV